MGKNIAVYAILSVIILMLGFVLYNTSFKRDTTQVVYRETGSADRVMKVSAGQVTVEDEIISDNPPVDPDALQETEPEENTEDGLNKSTDTGYSYRQSQTADTERIEADIEKLKEMVSDTQDGKDGEDGRDGKDGKNGAAGRQGTAGKNGADGKNGVDGKSTYIAYAEDASGKGFSLTPTEKTKCVGTCATTEKNQPMDPSAYTWQVYRSYVMTAVTDENNVTTLYIN